MLERIKATLFEAGSFVGHAIFVLIAVLFGVGQCVGSAKGFLACVSRDDARSSSEVQVRSLDPENPTDKRLIESLGYIGYIGGLKIEDIGAAVVEVDEINAASLGGGLFLFFEGLNRLDADSLDAIMAHEVAHATLMHVESSIERSDTIATITTIVGRLIGAEGTAIGEVQSWANSAVLPSYSREQELEADALAVELLETAGYERPEAVMRVALEMLLQEYGDTGGGFFDSHPSTAERVDIIRSREAAREQSLAIQSSSPP